MKTFTLVAATLAIIASSGAAEAKRAKYHGGGYRQATVERTSYRTARPARTTTRTAYRETYRETGTTGFFGGGFRTARMGGHDAGPRPAKWCGWYMRTQLGGGPEYNIAANWRNYGRPTSPQVGAVVVWPHHVGVITGRSSSGQWIVKSGNYSGGVREVPMNVSGAQFRI